MSDAPATPATPGAVDHDAYPPDYIADILRSVRTVALVGASPKPQRPAWIVQKYLQEKGYRVIPVNPGHAGGEILGAPVYARLADIPEPVDMVDIFRNSAAAAGVVEEVMALRPPPAVVWMQLGVRNDAAARHAEAAGLKVVMNRCPKIEYGRLSGEWGWLGGNDGAISARRPRLHASGRMQSLGLPGEPRREGD